jgi:hypothetical protein
LFWSYELDVEAMLAAVGGAPLGDPADPANEEAWRAAEEALADAPEAGPRDLTGVLAEQLPAGPGLAGWLASAEIGELADWDLPGVAAAYQRLASWAQAQELTAVATMASRAAARDPKAGVDGAGCPARVTAAAATEVSLALTMSQYGASWWAGLGVTLRWRLPDTGAALAAGAIDLTRARLIAEATGPLDPESARAVEALVLPGAGGQTTGQLRVALRRAVLAADPRGAEDRRRESERRAKVGFYPDPSGTAALIGSSLPGVRAAAAMARITAMAWAMKAAGAGGGIDFLRAQVFLGILLGTLPQIPPAADAPPGDPRPPGHPPDDPPPLPDPPDDPPPGHDDPPGPGDPPPPSPADAPDDTPRPGHASPPPGSPGAGPPRSQPGGRPPGSRPPRGRTTGERPTGGQPAEDPPADDQPAGREPTGGQPAESQPSTEVSAADADSAGITPAAADTEPWRDVPPPGDADAPLEDPGYSDAPRPEAHGYLDEDDPPGGIDPAWPPLPDTIDQLAPAFGTPPPPDNPPPGNTPPSHDATPPPDGTPPPSDPPPPHDSPPPRGTSPPRGDPPPQARGARPDPDTDAGATRPRRGSLDLTICWRILTGDRTAPAQLGRLGPISDIEALLLAVTAIPDPAAQWRVVLTDTAGRAIAVEKVRRGWLADNPGRAPGVVGRVTVAVPATILSQPDDGHDSSGGGRGIRAAVLRAARRAAIRAEQARAADAAAGGCAHTAATAAYRPPARLREFIQARDQTCRQPTCRQPAWHTDLDHTVPFHRGGLTCSCNIGGFCRTHHQVKQQPGWTVRQPAPGYFEITTPAGRSYTIGPDTYPV